MAWPFKRNKTNLPVEVQEYYQSEKRQRVGIAWVLAAGTLIVTVMIAVAVFFGGRWVYRKIANKDNTTTTVVQNGVEQKNDDTPPSSSGASTPSTQPSTPTLAPSTTATTTTPAPTPSVSVSNNNVTKKPVGVSSSTQSSVGTKTVPNTGPGDTLAIFVITVFVGYILHRKFLARS